MLNKEAAIVLHYDPNIITLDVIMPSAVNSYPSGQFYEYAIAHTAHELLYADPAKAMERDTRKREAHTRRILLEIAIREAVRN